MVQRRSETSEPPKGSVPPPPGTRQHEDSSRSFPSSSLTGPSGGPPPGSFANQSCNNSIGPTATTANNSVSLSSFSTETLSEARQQPCENPCIPKQITPDRHFDHGKENRKLKAKNKQKPSRGGHPVENAADGWENNPMTNVDLQDMSSHRIKNSKDYYLNEDSNKKEEEEDDEEEEGEEEEEEDYDDDDDDDNETLTNPPSLSSSSSGSLATNSTINLRSAHKKRRNTYVIPNMPDSMRQQKHSAALQAYEHWKAGKSSLRQAALKFHVDKNMVVRAPTLGQKKLHSRRFFEIEEENAIEHAITHIVSLEKYGMPRLIREMAEMVLRQRPNLASSSTSSSKNQSSSSSSYGKLSRGWAKRFIERHPHVGRGLIAYKESGPHPYGPFDLAQAWLALFAIAVQYFGLVSPSNLYSVGELALSEVLPQSPPSSASSKPSTQQQQQYHFIQTNPSFPSSTIPSSTSSTSSSPSSASSPLNLSSPRPSPFPSSGPSKSTETTILIETISGDGSILPSFVIPASRGVPQEIYRKIKTQFPDVSIASSSSQSGKAFRNHSIDFLINHFDRCTAAKSNNGALPRGLIIDGAGKLAGSITSSTTATNTSTSSGNLGSNVDDPLDNIKQSIESEFIMQAAKRNIVVFVLPKMPKACIIKPFSASGFKSAVRAGIKAKLQAAELLTSHKTPMRPGTASLSNLLNPTDFTSNTPSPSSHSISFPTGRTPTNDHTNSSSSGTQNVLPVSFLTASTSSTSTSSGGKRENTSLMTSLRAAAKDEEEGEGGKREEETAGKEGQEQVGEKNETTTKVHASRMNSLTNTGTIANTSSSSTPSSSSSSTATITRPDVELGLRTYFEAKKQVPIADTQAGFRRTGLVPFAPCELNKCLASPAMAAAAAAVAAAPYFSSSKPENATSGAAADYGSGAVGKNIETRNQVPPGVGFINAANSTGGGGSDSYNTTLGGMQKIVSSTEVLPQTTAVALASTSQSGHTLADSSIIGVERGASNSRERSGREEKEEDPSKEIERQNHGQLQQQPHQPHSERRDRRMTIQGILDSTQPESTPLPQSYSRKRTPEAETKVLRSSISSTSRTISENLPRYSDNHSQLPNKDIYRHEIKMISSGSGTLVQPGAGGPVAAKSTANSTYQFGGGGKNKSSSASPQVAISAQASSSGSGLGSSYSTSWVSSTGSHAHAASSGAFQATSTTSAGSHLTTPQDGPFFAETRGGGSSINRTGGKSSDTKGLVRQFPEFPRKEYPSEHRALIPGTGASLLCAGPLTCSYEELLARLGASPAEFERIYETFARVKWTLEEFKASFARQS